MSAQTKIWVQLLGAAFFAVLAGLEVTGLWSTAFGAQWGPYILALGCAVMLFEAWRTWRKLSAEQVRRNDSKNA